MQLISAVVRLAKVDEVCDAVQSFGFHGLTVTEALGFGKRRGGSQVFRGAVYSSKFEQRAKVEIVVAEEDVHDLVEIICKVAATGAIGDGKIWTSPVPYVVRIRTHEVGTDAL